MIKPNEFDFEKSFPVPEHIKERPELLELNAKIDQVIRMVNRCRDAQTNDPRMTEILKYISTIRAQTHDFSRVFAERLQAFAEGIKSSGNNDEKKFKAIGQKCIELHLLTTEELVMICGGKQENPKVLSKVIPETQDKQQFEHSPEDIYQKQPEAAESNNESSILDETRKFVNVSREIDKSYLNTSQSHENSITKASSFRHNENLRNSREPTRHNDSRIISEQIVQPKEGLLFSDRDSDDIQIKKSETNSEVRTEAGSKPRRRRRPQNPDQMGDPYASVQEDEAPQNKITITDSEERKQSINTSDMQSSTISSRTSESQRQLWNNYKIPILPEINPKTKESVSEGLLKLLSDQYGRTDEIISKIKTLQEKALKYCSEESIMDVKGITHYGQRMGPSFFEKANYNISIDGELKSSDLLQGMKALGKRFRNLVGNYEREFKYRFYPSCRFGVPKLLFYYKQIDATILFTLNDEIGKTSSKLISAYRRYHPLADQLLMIIKLWSSFHQIADDSTGFLSPFAWENLVIFFLQALPQKILPSFQQGLKAAKKTTVQILNENKELVDVTCDFSFKNSPSEDPTIKQITLFDVVGKFFRYYTENYESQDIISIRIGALLKSQSLERNYLFSIEDPFIPDFDLGRSCLRNSPQAETILSKMKDALAGLKKAELRWIYP